ncbi:MAG: thioredoxin [Spirochaetales bacterium]|nr:thioredoxin [Spirochaetales bacterium]
MSEVILTDEIFESEVMESSMPVLIDFWAEWCVPCRMLTPIIEDLAAQYEGKVKVVKANVDECPQTASRHNIQSIPTLMVFHKGEVVSQNIGVIPKAAIEEMFTSLI